MRAFRCGMFDHRLVANVAMATAVSGGLTHTTPGDVLSWHRAGELTGSGGCRRIGPANSTGAELNAGLGRGED